MSRGKQNNNQSMEVSLEEVEFFKNPQSVPIQDMCPEGYKCVKKD